MGSFQDFAPSQQFLIGNPDRSFKSAFKSNQPAIAISRVDASGQVIERSYESILSKGIHSSIVLIDGTQRGDETPLATTNYKMVHGARIHIHNPNGQDLDDFKFKQKGMVSRSRIFSTKVGDFEWRYGSKSEGGNNLLVLDKVDGGRTVKIAELARNGVSLTTLSCNSGAGNGGVLAMDLGPLVREKGDARTVEILVISSCMAMLKAERDRQQNNDAAVASAIS